MKNLKTVLDEESDFKRRHYEIKTWEERVAKHKQKVVDLQEYIHNFESDVKRLKQCLREDVNKYDEKKAGYDSDSD